MGSVCGVRARSEFRTGVVRSVVPDHIIWGARHPNLNLNIARDLQQEISHSTLTLFLSANHWLGVVARHPLGGQDFST